AQAVTRAATHLRWSCSMAARPASSAASRLARNAFASCVSRSDRPGLPQIGFSTGAEARPQSKLGPAAWAEPAANRAAEAATDMRRERRTESPNARGRERRLATARKRFKRQGLNYEAIAVSLWQAWCEA